MKRLLLTLLTIALALPACGDDDGSGPDLITMEDVAGAWAATMFRAVSLDDPSVQFELIAAGGAMSVVVQPNGSFSGSVTFPNPAVGQLVTIPIAGTFTMISQTEMNADFAVEIPPLLEDGLVEFELVGNTLSLHQDVTNFDFDNDGQFEDAVFDATMVRQ